MSTSTSKTSQGSHGGYNVSKCHLNILQTATWWSFSETVSYSHMVQFSFCSVWNQNTQAHSTMLGPSAHHVARVVKKVMAAFYRKSGLDSVCTLLCTQHRPLPSVIDILIVNRLIPVSTSNIDHLQFPAIKSVHPFCFVRLNIIF